MTAISTRIVSPAMRRQLLDRGEDWCFEVPGVFGVFGISDVTGDTLLFNE
jgi:hypothetical protein